MDLSGWVGVGLGGNGDCMCGILYAPILGRGWFLRDWLVWHLLRNLRNFLFPAGGLSASRVLLCVRRLGAFGFLWEREQVCLISLFFRRVHTVAPMVFVMSVCGSVCPSLRIYYLGFHCMDFCSIWYWKNLSKSSTFGSSDLSTFYCCWRHKFTIKTLSGNT